MKNIFLMTIFTLFTLTACRNEDVSNSQVETTADPKINNSTEQEVRQKSAINTDDNLSKNNNPKKIDCESSPEAYQSCLAQMSSEGSKNALPTEFYGNWGFNRNKDQCFFEGGGVQISKELFETFAYVNKDSMGWDGECKILDVERETSVGHMKLSLECLDDIVNPEKSGNHSRNLNVIIVNENLEISEDSDNPNLGVQTLYRCPEIADPNN
jgi:hypothetical protein